MTCLESCRAEPACPCTGSIEVAEHSWNSAGAAKTTVWSVCKDRQGRPSPFKFFLEHWLIEAIKGRWGRRFT